MTWLPSYIYHIPISRNRTGQTVKHPKIQVNPIRVLDPMTHPVVLSDCLLLVTVNEFVLMIPKLVFCV